MDRVRRIKAHGDDEQEYRKITIGFYKPSDDTQGQATSGFWGSAINWVIGRWTSQEGRQYSHVELRFQDLYSTSICHDSGKVHMLDGKTMGSPKYTAFLSLNIERDKEQAMRNLAEEYHARQVGFNMKGMMCNFMPIFSSCMYNNGTDNQGVQKQVFCSQYIVLLFQAAGYLMDVDPGSTSPTDLYYALINEGARGDINHVTYEKRKKKRGNHNPLNVQRSLTSMGSNQQRGTRHGYIR